jgi:hypothetical protein
MTCLSQGRGLGWGGIVPRAQFPPPQLGEAERICDLTGARFPLYFADAEQAATSERGK